jgi:hypothetical protein
MTFGGAESVNYNVYYSYMDNERYIYDLNDTQVEITGLQIGVIYRFEVQAYNSYKAGGPSEQYSLRVIGVPGTPFDLGEKIDLRSDTGVILEW